MQLQTGTKGEMQTVYLHTFFQQVVCLSVLIADNLVYKIKTACI